MNRRVSLKRTIITNAAVFGVLLIVCIAAFGQKLPAFFSKTANYPAFSGTNGKNHVGLEIAVCDAANFDLELLKKNGKGASIFFCGDIWRNNQELIRQCKDAGFFVGHYLCGNHALDEIGEDDYVLCSPYSKTGKIGTYLSYTIDANKVYNSGGKISLNENAIIMYNISDGNETLSRLLNEIAASGYSIMPVDEIID